MPIGHILMLLVEELLLSWLLVAIVVALEAACHAKVVDKELDNLCQCHISYKYESIIGNYITSITKRTLFKTSGKVS